MKSLIFLLIITMNIGSGFSSTSIVSNKIKTIRKNKNDLKLLSIPTEVEILEKVTPGCVLVAQPHEYNHFMVKAVVLVYDHGKGETHGVILERPTAFTMGETAPGIGIFEANTLYMGGEDGNNMAMMLHKYELGGTSKPIGNGIYLGGMKEAQSLVKNRYAHPKDFKFIFNYSTWPKGLLEQEINEGRWDILRCPPDMLLRQENDSLWTRCRRELKKLGKIKSTSFGDSDE
jgi:putative AlgH/UPF0301 family transcriptional regulator